MDRSHVEGQLFLWRKTLSHAGEGRIATSKIHVHRPWCSSWFADILCTEDCDFTKRFYTGHIYCSCSRTMWNSIRTSITAPLREREERSWKDEEPNNPAERRRPTNCVTPERTNSFDCGMDFLSIHIRRF
ncbi:hypothetical protein SKAU_G00357790 [Synaphobranchus kaupii]|uniref:Uncharacterized protein n=1 Tax=Synaphobranchus kaupii TaxID=118154 RepID=A0A9Q1EHN9_SYNKA|nr:hypothetical protein SKAU_G00357790 [Synaphobranchus kaupii]